MMQSISSKHPILNDFKRITIVLGILIVCLFCALTTLLYEIVAFFDSMFNDTFHYLTQKLTEIGGETSKISSKNRSSSEFLETSESCKFKCSKCFCESVSEERDKNNLKKLEAPQSSNAKPSFSESWEFRDINNFSNCTFGRKSCSSYNHFNGGGDRETTVYCTINGASIPPLFGGASAIGAPAAGRSTMTAVGSRMGSGGSSTMTAIGGAPMGGNRSTMTDVGAPMGGGQSTTNSISGTSTVSDNGLTSPFIANIGSGSNASSSHSHFSSGSFGNSNTGSISITAPSKTYNIKKIKYTK